MTGRTHVTLDMRGAARKHFEATQSGINPYGTFTLNMNERPSRSLAEISVFAPSKLPRKLLETGEAGDAAILRRKSAHTSPFTCSRRRWRGDRRNLAAGNMGASDSLGIPVTSVVAARAPSCRR